MKKTLELTEKQLASANYRNIITIDCDITDSEPYLYVMLNIPRGKAYAGLSYATGKTHGREGKTHMENFYSGSPHDHNAMRKYMDSDPPEHFVKVIIQNFPLPKSYARWGDKRKRKWIDENLGQGERELIEHLRTKYGNHNKDDNGILTNVGDGGLNGNGFKSGEEHCHYGRLGADHPQSMPVIELVSGNRYAGTMEAARETGLKQPGLSGAALRNRKLMESGKSPRSSRNESNGKGEPNPFFGTCWVFESDLVEAVNAGHSVEVHAPLYECGKKAETVHGLREQGLSWKQVSSAMGESAQGVRAYHRKRFSQDFSDRRIAREERNLEIARLRDDKGMTFREIGMALDMNPGTVKSAYHKITESLGQPDAKKLKREQRNLEIVRLRDNEGMTWREIAETLDTRDSTAFNAYRATKHFANAKGNKTKGTKI